MSSSSTGSSSVLQREVASVATSPSATNVIEQTARDNRVSSVIIAIKGFFELDFFEQFGIDFKSLTALSWVSKWVRPVFLMKNKWRVGASKEAFYSNALRIALTVGEKLRPWALSHVSVEVAKDNPEKACRVADLALEEAKACPYNHDEYEFNCSFEESYQNSPGYVPTRKKYNIKEVAGDLENPEKTRGDTGICDSAQKASDIVELIFTPFDDYVSPGLINDQTLCMVVPKMAAKNSKDLLPTLEKIRLKGYRELAFSEIALELAKHHSQDEYADKDAEMEVLGLSESEITHEPDATRSLIEALSATSAQRAIRFATGIQDVQRLKYHDVGRDITLAKVANRLFTSQPSPDAALTALFLVHENTEPEIVEAMFSEAAKKNLSAFVERIRLLPPGRKRDEILMMLIPKTAQTDPAYAKQIASYIHDNRWLKKKAMVKIATAMLKDHAEEAHAFFKSLGVLDLYHAEEFIEEVSKYDLETAISIALQTVHDQDGSVHHFIQNLLLRFGIPKDTVDTSRAFDVLARPEFSNLNCGSISWYKDQIMVAIVEQAAKKDLELAMSYLPQMPSDFSRNNALDIIDKQRIINATETIKLNIQAAEMLAQKIEDKKERDKVYGLIAKELIKNDIPGAVRVANEISDRPVRNEVFLDLVREVAKKDLDQALAMVLTNDMNTNGAYSAIAIDLAPLDTLMALKVARHIEHRAVYAKTLAAIGSLCNVQSLPGKYDADTSGYNIIALGFGNLIKFRPLKKI